MSREHPDLDIEEDVEFQQREWRLQRAGMVLLFLFVAGAALGITGMRGPLSTGHAGRFSDGVSVDYERFVRRGASSIVTLHLRGTRRPVQFWVSDPYFQSVRIEGIAPIPQSVSVDNGRHVYTIASRSADVTIALEVEHMRAGRIDASIGLIDGPAVQFTQWVWF